MEKPPTWVAFLCLSKKRKAPNSPLKSAIYWGNLQSFTLRGLFATKSVVFFGYKKGCLIFEHSI